MKLFLKSYPGTQPCFSLRYFHVALKSRLQIFSMQPITIQSDQITIVILTFSSRSPTIFLVFLFHSEYYSMVVFWEFGNHYVFVSLSLSPTSFRFLPQFLVFPSLVFLYSMVVLLYIILKLFSSLYFILSCLTFFFLCLSIFYSSYVIQSSVSLSSISLFFILFA